MNWDRMCVVLQLDNWMTERGGGNDNIGRAPEAWFQRKSGRRCLIRADKKLLVWQVRYCKSLSVTARRPVEESRRRTLWQNRANYFLPKLANRVFAACKWRGGDGDVFYSHLLSLSWPCLWCDYRSIGGPTGREGESDDNVVCVNKIGQWVSLTKNR